MYNVVILFSYNHKYYMAEWGLDDLEIHSLFLNSITELLLNKSCIMSPTFCALHSN